MDVTDKVEVEVTLPTGNGAVIVCPVCGLPGAKAVESGSVNTSVWRRCVITAADSAESTFVSRFEFGDRVRIDGSTFVSRFEFGDRVRIDGSDLAGTVTRFGFADTGAREVEVAWFASGDLKSEWVAESRLEKIGHGAR